MSGITSLHCATSGSSPSSSASWRACGAAPSSSSSPSPSDGSLLAWHLALEVALVDRLCQAAGSVRHGIARGIHAPRARRRATVRATGSSSRAGRGRATHQLLRGCLLGLLLLLHLLHRERDGVALDVLGDLLAHGRVQIG